MTQPATDAASRRDRVAIGTSSGGLSALRRIVADLPADYPGAVFVVQHLSPGSPSQLPALLSGSGALPAVAARDGMPIEPGHIHVAPPDHHLLVERERLRVTRGPRENRHRPAIDPLFRSLAWSFGPRAVGVVLTGNLDDGTAGLWAVSSCGGTTVVQDPDNAEYPQMPANALLHNRVDHRLPLEQIGALIGRLAHEPAPAAPANMPATIADELAFVQHRGGVQRAQRLGALSPFTCPSCSGALWELDEGGHLRYRCHTGHAFSQASLLTDLDVAAEESLFTALRTVEEKVEALRRLAEQWKTRVPEWRDDYLRRADHLERAARTLRALLAGEPVPQ
jgi:two-component system chemotaxis response regulator CheB